MNPDGDGRFGERRLRDALAALGDVPSPAGDLAGAALARSRRERRRSVAIAVVAGLAVVAAVAVPAVALGHRPARQQASRVVVPGTGTHVVEAYSAVGADRWVPGATSLLLDRAAGAYVPVPVDWLAASPGGRWVAVWDESDAGRPAGGVRSGTLAALPRQAIGPQRAGVAERTALLRDGLAAVRWVPLAHPYRPSWSADGRLLVSARLAVGSVTRVVVVDPATGRFTRDATVRTAYADPEVAEASWAPDGTGFALPAGTDGPLWFFDWSGRPTGTWAVPGGTLSPGPPSSGLAVLTTTVDYRAGASGWGVDGRAQLVLDVVTGREVARFPGATPLAGWYDPAHLLRLAPGRPGPVLDVVDLQGQVIAEVSVEPHRPVRAGWVQIGSAEGLPPAAYRLRF